MVSATAILDLARESAETVRCEAIAALANLAVNGVRVLHCSLLLRAVARVSMGFAVVHA